LDSPNDVGGSAGGVGNPMNKIRNAKLEIRNLKVSVEGKEIIKGISLGIKAGEVHALMGPNGSGKSTLAHALAGHPNLRVSGKISLGGKVISGLKPEERARAGLFLAFQYPVGTEGVTLFNFLKTARENLDRSSSASALLTELKSLTSEVGLDESFLKRDLNFDLSGGEKKRSEVLQALTLKPKIAIFDETDSGLDVDALKLVARKIRELAESGTGVLVVTHYQRILQHLRPDFVHVLVGGRIVESGDAQLAKRLEEKGYRSYQ